jgi:hypothetical protein
MCDKIIFLHNIKINFYKKENCSKIVWMNIVLPTRTLKIESHRTLESNSLFIGLQPNAAFTKFMQ